MNEFMKFLDNISDIEKEEIINEWIEYKETGILENGILRTKSKELGDIASTDATRFFDTIANFVTLDFAKKYIALKNQLEI